MPGFLAALKLITDPAEQTLRCEHCHAEYLEDCDTRRHLATPESYAAYLRRTHRIWTIKRAALGAEA